jgi:hypothetical protein
MEAVILLPEGLQAVDLPLQESIHWRRNQRAVDVVVNELSQKPGQTGAFQHQDSFSL